jgi:Zn-finger nucleic acid-binding protein
MHKGLKMIKRRNFLKLGLGALFLAPVSLLLGKTSARPENPFASVCPSCGEDIVANNGGASCSHCGDNFRLRGEMGKVEEDRFFTNFKIHEEMEIHYNPAALDKLELNETYYNKNAKNRCFPMRG